MQNERKIINKNIDFTKPEYKIRVNKLLISRKSTNINKINNLNTSEATNSNINSNKKNNNNFNSPDPEKKSSKSLKIIKELNSIGKNSNSFYPIHRTYSENTYNCPVNLFSSRLNKEEGNIIYDFQKKNKYLRSMLNNKNLEQKLSKLSINQPFSKLLGISLDDCLSKSRKDSLKHTRSPKIENENSDYENKRYDVNSYNYKSSRSFILSEDKTKRINKSKNNNNLNELKDVNKNKKNNEFFRNKDMKNNFKLKTMDDQKIEKNGNRMLTYNILSDDETNTFSYLKSDNDDVKNYFLYKKSKYESQDKNNIKQNSIASKKNEILMDRNCDNNYKKYTFQNISKLSDTIEHCFFNYLKKKFEKFINNLKKNTQSNEINQRIYHKRSILRCSKIKKIKYKLIPIKDKIINSKNNKDKNYNIQLISNEELIKKIINKPKNMNPKNKQFYACYFEKKKKKPLNNQNSTDKINFSKIYTKKKTLYNSSVKKNENSLNKNNYFNSRLSPLNKNQRFFYELYTDDENSISNYNSNLKKYTTGQLIINHINSSKNYNNYIFNYNSDSYSSDNNTYIGNSDTKNKIKFSNSFNKNIERNSTNTTGKCSKKEIIYQSIQANPSKIKNYLKNSDSVISKIFYNSARTHNIPKINKQKKILIKNIGTTDKKLFINIKYIWIDDPLYNKKLINRRNSLNKFHYYKEKNVNIIINANRKKKIGFKIQKYQDSNSNNPYTKIKYSNSFVDIQNAEKEKNNYNFNKVNTFNYNKVNTVNYNNNDNMKEKDKNINKILINCVKLLVKILNKIIRKKVFNDVKKFNLK